MGRVTIKDISNRLGVSANTVSKALNGKDKISEAMRAKVWKTAQEMGYQPNRFASALARNEIKIGIIMPREPRVFMDEVIAGINCGVQELIDERVSADFLFLEDCYLNEEKELSEFTKQQFDAYIVSPGMYFKNSQWFKRYLLQGEKKPQILFLLNEISNIPSAGCVRLDGIATGHVACEMLHVFTGKPGRVAVLSADNEVQVHKDCVKGFRDEAQKYQMSVLVEEMYDDYELAYDVTKRLMSEYDDIIGMYITSFNSLPVCNCLKDLEKNGEVAVIAHDVFDASADKMKEGEIQALLYQDPFMQGKSAVEKISSLLIEGKKIEDSLVMPQIVIRSNLSYFCEKEKAGK